MGYSPDVRSRTSGGTQGACSVIVIDMAKCNSFDEVNQKKIFGNEKSERFPPMKQRRFFLTYLNDIIHIGGASVFGVAMPGRVVVVLRDVQQIPRRSAWTEFLLYKQWLDNLCYLSGSLPKLEIAYRKRPFGFAKQTTAF